MEEKVTIYDVANQTYIIINNFEKTFIEKIPQRVISVLKELSKKSDKNFEIQEGKSLMEQEINEETKDLLSYIYFNCVATEDQKKELLKIWNENEKKYNQFLKEKYSYEKLFNKESDSNINNNNDEKNNEEKSLVEYKQGFFEKIKDFILNLFKKQK